MSNIPTKRIDGDAAIGRNVTAGGDVDIQGNVRIGHDLKVEGWLEAKNLRGVCKGLYRTEKSLKDTYPAPSAGWWALVGDGLPAQIYVSEGGKWTGLTNADGSAKLGGNPTIDTSAWLEEYVKELAATQAAAREVLDGAQDAARDAADSAHDAADYAAEAKGAAEKNFRPFSGFPLSSPTLTLGSAPNPKTIKFDKTHKTFYCEASVSSPGGLTSPAYYANWQGSERYGTPGTHGVTPAQGRLYLDESEEMLYIWDGHDMLPVGKRHDTPLGDVALEHVTVNVRGLTINASGEDCGISGAGATVYLDIFNAKGYPAISLPRQTLTADAQGMVSFDVPRGMRYAVSAKITGLGRSFQLVEMAGGVDRKLSLWCFKTGVMCLYFALYRDINSPASQTYYRVVPVITPDYIQDHGGDYANDMALWDSANNEDVNEVIDDMSKHDQFDFLGVLVSGENSSFVIPKDNLAKGTLQWAPQRECSPIPTLPDYAGWDQGHQHDGQQFEEGLLRAQEDFNGNLNTAKIIDALHSAPAAEFAPKSHRADEQPFLPAYGQLLQLHDAAEAANVIMQAHNDKTGTDDFALLPFLGADNFVLPCNDDEWWSSTQYDGSRAWALAPETGYLIYARCIDIYVRSLSVFRFDQTNYIPIR